MTTRSILICDDERELASELGEFFSFAGWQVIICYSGTEATRELIGSHKLSCLLTDLRVADFDGAELIKLARRLPQSKHPTVTAIMTGHVMDHAEAADYDCDLLYVKPVDPDAIMAEVERLLLARQDLLREPG
jgi:DNA-binding response OmpR family regulator